MIYYRITIYDWEDQKDVILEDDDDDCIIDQAEECLQDLFKGNIKTMIVSKISGRTGIRDDM